MYVGVIITTYVLIYMYIFLHCPPNIEYFSFAIIYYYYTVGLSQSPFISFLFCRILTITTVPGYKHKHANSRSHVVNCCSNDNFFFFFLMRIHDEIKRLTFVGNFTRGKLFYFFSFFKTFTRYGFKFIFTRLPVLVCCPISD